MAADKLSIFDNHVETDLQRKFWGSRHKCNKMKSIIAFSSTLSNANDNLRRYGYTRAWRKRALMNFGKYVNKPDFGGVPFSELSTPWWKCMPYSPDDTSKELRDWIDTEFWEDKNQWGY